MTRRQTVGILREVKSQWERRVPLTPTACQQLQAQHHLQLRLQPSTNRIFADQLYRDVGVEITDDLTDCNIILGVKEPAIPALLPKHSYLTFNHVIKAQPYNMPLLDHCLQHDIRLYDYEAIRDPASGQRLIAFGYYAGVAGALDTLRGLGQRMLSLGYSTPFLHIASTYQYQSLQHAESALRDIGRHIEQEGLPAAISPLVVTITGTGKVSAGVRRMLELLPHEYVTPEQLPKLCESQAGTQHKVHLCVITAKNMVQRVDGDQSSHFDSKHYYKHPECYAPVAHHTVLPYTTVLMQGHYWEPQYPRLLTSQQLLELQHTHVDRSGRRKLQVIGDISCDLGGSIEFVSRATTIDQPFYLYDVKQQREASELDSRDGVLVQSIDMLPTECALDSSNHFSSALLPYLAALAQSDHSKPFVTSAQQYLPPEVYNACITADGKLTPNYEYIAKLREANEKAAAASAAEHTAANASETTDMSKVRTILLEGHLFDTGIINTALDVMERTVDNFAIVNINVMPNRLEREANVSSMLVNVTVSEGTEQLDSCMAALQQMIDRCPAAKASAQVLPVERTVVEGSSSGAKQYADSMFKNGVNDKGVPPSATPPATSSLNATSTSTPTSASEQRVLILGSGFVAAPVVEYLSRSQQYAVTVASNILADAQQLVEGFDNVTALQLDINNSDAVQALVGKHDIVISLLPAAFHMHVAKECVAQKKHLVTASYLSDEMRSLHTGAQQAGILLLNECGLDPGIDHMSAMKVIDEVHEQGGKIRAFSSVCGGLPAPEAAVDNPFAYKMSWSPVGVLNALMHAAQYMKDGKLIEIAPNGHILRHTEPTTIFPSLRLEHYANRNSMQYAPVYNLQDEVHTMYRGTLRYEGYSELVNGLLVLGLMDQQHVIANAASTSWLQVLSQYYQCSTSEVRSAMADRLQQGGVTDSHTIQRIVSACEWLSLLSDDKAVCATPSTMFAAFCQLLQRKLRYYSGERDMVAMHHTFDIEWSDKSRERRISSLLTYGGDGKQKPTVQQQQQHSVAAGGGKTGYSAMARTVGYPVALAAELVLQKTITARGTHIPTIKQIYEPILHHLKVGEDIDCKEQTVSVEMSDDSNADELRAAALKEQVQSVSRSQKVYA